MAEQKEVIKFTDKDLFCESMGVLLHTGNPFAALKVIISGTRYNEAKDSGDSASIVEAYNGLHHELKLFKKNFLNRGKGHW